MSQTGQTLDLSDLARESQEFIFGKLGLNEENFRVLRRIVRTGKDKRVHPFDSWSDFYEACSGIEDDTRTIVMIRGGINYGDAMTKGLIAVDGGINRGNITADYVMYGGGINKGTIWAKEGFWRGGGIFPNVFIGPDKEPFDEKTYSKTSN